MSAASHTDPTVLIFATGGTIGMRETDTGLAPDPDFPEVLDALAAELAAPLGIRTRVNHLQPAIDSANADAETAPKIARALIARVRTYRPRGVVITHGTDTLAYTGARLAFELADLHAPVVLTGSQFPHGVPGSDAAENLRLAIRTAARVSRSAPVSLAFDGELLPAVRVSKADADSLHAFRAERDFVPGGAGVPSVPNASGGGAPARVITFRFTPGTSPEDLLGAVSSSPDGLILECYGAGNAPTGRPGMLDAIAQVTARIPVVAVTQCARGSVSLGRYAVGSDLAHAGVVTGSDLTLEAAIGKLGYLLDAGLTGTPLEQALRTNLVGEMVDPETS